MVFGPDCTINDLKVNTVVQKKRLINIHTSINRNL